MGSRTSGLAQFACHLGCRSADARSQPDIQSWVGRQVQLQARENIEHACDHEVGHVPLFATEEPALDELLLKNGELGPQRLFGLIGQSRASLLRGVNRRGVPTPIGELSY
jgi:hypothetical protein